MVNEKRIVMRNDFSGPPNGNRPLLRLSRFGGGGVFYIPGNQEGYATAVHPSGRTQPFIQGVQGGYERKDARMATATSPDPNSVARGDKLGFGLRINPYAAPRGPVTSRGNFFANRGSKKCPSCGR